MQRLRVKCLRIIPVTFNFNQACYNIIKQQMMHAVFSYMRKVCIARGRNPPRTFDALYIFTIKFSESPPRNFQTFQSGMRTTQKN
jgi:hypothetical protein